MFSPGRVVDLKARTKEGVLEELVDVLATAPEVQDRDELLRCILEREKTLSTGVGIGIAIPHVKIPSVSDFAIAVGRHQRGVEFQSIDEKPVHLVVMIACNDRQAGEYLKVISILVRSLKDEAFRRRVLLARGPEEVIDLFVGPDGVFPK